MKKVILLATAFMFVTGVALADKGKKKKCAKGKTRDRSRTPRMKGFIMRDNPDMVEL